MNKLLTKIVGVVLGTTMAVGVGVGVAVNSDRANVDSQVNAEELQASFNGTDNDFSGSSGTIKDSKNYSWSYTRTGDTTSYSANNGYRQIGKNGGIAEISLSTSAIPGTIKSVSVDCAAYQGKHNVEITVGGTTYLSSTAVPTWSSNRGGTKTGTGTSSGEIVIGFTKNATTARALYIKSVTVTYDNSVTPTPTTYSVTYKSGEGTGNDYEVTGQSGSYTLLNYTDNHMNYTAPQYCTFAGWSVVIGSAAATTVAAGQPITVSANTICTALWTDSRSALTLTVSATDDVTNIDIGSTTTLIVTATSGSAVTGLSYSYSSSDNNVATVSSSTVTGVAVGSATITVSFAGNATYKPVSATIDITVYNSKAVEIDFVAKYGTTTTDVKDIDQIIDSTYGTKVVFTNSSGTAPKYYSGGVRCYGNNTFTVSSSARKLKTITLAFGSGEDSKTITANNGTYSEPTWSAGDATNISSVTFTIASGTGNRRIAKISVEYIVQGATVVITSNFSLLKVVGDTNTVVANIVDPVGTEGSITFASTVPEVATIDSSTGEVEAKGVGTTTINVTATGAVSASFELKVLSAHSGVTVDDPLTQPEAVNFLDNLPSSEFSDTRYYVGGTVTSISSGDYYLDNTEFELYGATAGTGIDLSNVKVGRYVVGYGLLKLSGDSDYYLGGTPTIVFIAMPEVNSIAFTNASMTKTTYSSKDNSWDVSGLVVNGTFQDESVEEITSLVEWSFSVFSPASVSFDEEASKTFDLIVTATYSGKTANKTVSVTVTNDGMTIHTIDGGWEVVSNISNLSAGDKVVIGESSKGYVMTSTAPASGTLGVASATFADGKISTLPDSAIQLTVGGSSGAWTLTNSAGQYLKVDGSNNSRHLAFQDSKSTFNITISDDNATIGGTVRILLNSSANPARFSTYNSDLSASMLLPEIYKLSGVYQIDNDSDLITAIDGFYSTNQSESGSKFVCDANGVNFDAAHWNNNSALSALKTKYELNKIVANPNGNKVEQFLSMYDYVIGTKKIELGIAAYSTAQDFLGRFEEGGIHYNPANPMVNKTANSSNLTVVSTTIIISIISLSTLCGYFLLRILHSFSIPS